MVAYEVMITDPARPWLRWRRVAPRWLRLCLAVPSQELAIAEARAHWRKAFGAPPGPDTQLTCSGFEQLPLELIRRQENGRPQMNLEAWNQGHHWEQTGDWTQISGRSRPPN